MRLAPAALLLLGLWLAPGPAGADSPTRDVHEVQVAFLYRFLFFVQQGGEAWKGEGEEPLRVLVLGDPPNPRQWSRLGERTVDGRPIELDISPRWPEGFDADVVLVTAAWERDHRELLARVRGRPVLTVGAVEGFARDGGCIEFRVEEGRLGFLVNRSAVRGQGLELGSPLLRVARRVLP